MQTSVLRRILYLVAGRLLCDPKACTLLHPQKLLPRKRTHRRPHLPSFLGQADPRFLFCLLAVMTEVVPTCRIFMPWFHTHTHTPPPLSSLRKWADRNRGVVRCTKKKPEKERKKEVRGRKGKTHRQTESSLPLSSSNLPRQPAQKFCSPALVRRRKISLEGRERERANCKKISPDLSQVSLPDLFQRRELLRKERVGGEAFALLAKAGSLHAWRNITALAVGWGRSDTLAHSFRAGATRK